MRLSEPFEFDPKAPAKKETQTIRSIVLKSPAGRLASLDVDRTIVPVEATVGEIRQLFGRYIPEGWVLYAFSPEFCSKVVL